MARNADATKQRIFDAAVEEFAERGFDGARIDKIAERAGVNKRMIYFYWGDKDELFRTILSSKVTLLHEIFVQDWGKTSENLIRYFQGAGREIELLRFVQWEALAYSGEPVVAEDERRAAFKEKAAVLRKDQRRGQVSPDIKPEYLLLVFMALACYPMAFPQNTQLVTGSDWQDPKFQKQWSDTLKFLADRISPPTDDTD